MRSPIYTRTQRRVGMFGVDMELTHIKNRGLSPVVRLPVVRLNSETDDARFADWANLLFEQALLAEGGQLDDPASFVRRLNGLLAMLPG